MGPRLRALGVLGATLFSAPAFAADTIKVTIDKLQFAPAQVSARVGDTIEWANRDFVAHTATARNKDWDVTIPANGIGRAVLQHPGDIDYFCRFHPNMTGRISVTPDQTVPCGDALIDLGASPAAQACGHRPWRADEPFVRRPRSPHLLAWNSR